MKDEGVKGLSIFYRFLLAFLAIVVFVNALLIIIFYGYSKNAIEEQARERINQDFDSLTHQFQDILKEKLSRDLKIISTNPILDAFFMASELEKEIEARAVERLFLQSIQYTESHISISFVNYAGIEMIKVDRDGRSRDYQDIGRTSLFTELENSALGEIIVQGPFKSLDGEHYMSVGIAKADPDIGQFGGAVIIDYSLEGFFDQLRNITFRGVKPVWVFAPSGQVLMEPSSEGEIFDPRPYFNDYNGCQMKSIMTSEGIIFCQDLSILSGQPILRVAISIPSTLLLQDIRSMVKFLLLVSLVAIIFITLVVYFISRYMSEPIIKLASAAARLSKGDITTRVDIKTTGEVQLLVDSFNKMAADLEKTTVSKDYVDNIIKSMMDMMIVLSPEGTITRANAAACRHLGYGEEELFGRPIELILDEPIDSDSLSEIFSHESTSNIETTYVTKDGDEMIVLLSAATLRDSEGGLQGWVFVAQDITERKKAEQALAEKTQELGRSNAELQQFANVASHDLQEPLRKVMTFGERLDDKYGDVLDERGRDYLSRMRDASQRMQHFIEDLLSFSRVTTKAKPFQKVDLNQIIREILLTLEVRLEESGGHVDVAELMQIEADPFQIMQLFQNLIGNALKFAKPGVPPQVKIYGSMVDGEENAANNFRNSPKYYQIVVEDNGIGFDEKYSERIFGVFQRLHGKNDYAGTGIGLSVCQKIVERHNGTIKAVGVVNEGATVITTLPVKQSVVNIFNG